MAKFLTRHKLKVQIKGEETKIHKSDSLDYIMGKIEDYKKLYPKDKVEFYRVKSEVMLIKKPNRIFKNLPDWKNISYGQNSDGGYYLLNNDTQKIIRIYEEKL